MYLILMTLALSLPAETGTFVEGKQHKAGFYDLYWDDEGGKLFLAIDQFDAPFLLHTHLVTGLGSNDVGLDRGKPGIDRVVHFHKVGQRVFLIQPNLTYRAHSDNPSERNAVAESFASSVLWSADIEEQDGTRVYVSLDSLALFDHSYIAESLSRPGKGSYTLDKSRSFYFQPNLKAFPDNTEVEATLTFEGKPSGGQVAQVSADASAISLRQRISFIRLPDDGYETRPFHPGSSGLYTQWYDYAAPLDSDLAKRFLLRHRLKLSGSDGKSGEVVEPIIYYVDNGAPEQIRQALIEGASWWNQAFEAAGYKNAFQVKVMPPDMDPMDIRYNIVQWVHRSTRGWSYGSAINDPRTGEIIKGHVNLGSLRVRQDCMLFEGMLARDKDGAFPEGVDPVELALARIRQLAAHEVGHTLGLSHNFISSLQGRASVMDYPAPLVRLKGGSIDTSHVYDTAIGAWDKVSISCLYGIMENPMEEMNQLLESATKKGLTFIGDQHSRSAGSMHPGSHLWDNGSDALDEMDRVVQLRAFLLKQFSARNLKSGEMLALLEEVLVPVYLHHRFQLQAVASSLGGADFDYGFNDGKSHFRTVGADRQNRALDALLHTLSSEFLEVPPQLIGLIPPRPPGYDHHRELFDRRTGDRFDTLAMPETAAQMTLDLLLGSTRLNRMHEQHFEAETLPGVEVLLGKLSERLRQQPQGRAGVLHRQVNHQLLNQLIRTVADANLREEVRALISYELSEWASYFEAASGERVWLAHYHWLGQRLSTLDEEMFKPSRKLKTPPGSPI